MTTKPTLIVITGPTGSGKTELSMKIAKHFNCPIIGADSRQIFRGMPIGTAQPSIEQQEEVEHHLIASHDIAEHYTAGRYEQDALRLLEELFKKNATVVAVGGSGLYIDALCSGMDSLPKGDLELRAQLTARLNEQGIDSLLNELKEVDPDYYNQVDRDNPKRIIRALEVCLLSGKPYSTQRKGGSVEREFNIVKIGTTMERQKLYERINRRVDIMIEEGLVQESRTLYPHRELNSLQTVGYREIFQYFDGEITLAEAIELIKRNSRRYAKRQITWFGRDEQITWFDPNDVPSVIKHIENKIEQLT